MAGTLTISTLSDGTNSTSSTNCIQGSAKAWVNFNGTTSPGTIRAQYNVSSVTKNGTGDYTINFTNALADANYSVAGLSGWDQNSYGLLTNAPTGGYSTTAYRVITINPSGNRLDNAYIAISIFR